MKLQVQYPTIIRLILQIMMIMKAIHVVDVLTIVVAIVLKYVRMVAHRDAATTRIKIYF